MKILHKELTTCFQCPYLEYTNTGEDGKAHFYCKGHRALNNAVNSREYLGYATEHMDPIPDSCPLPDKEEE